MAKLIIFSALMCSVAAFAQSESACRDAVRKATQCCDKPETCLAEDKNLESTAAVNTTNSQSPAAAQMNLSSAQRCYEMLGRCRKSCTNVNSANLDLCGGREEEVKELLDQATLDAENAIDIRKAIEPVESATKAAPGN